jgi:uncharacterized protein
VDALSPWDVSIVLGLLLRNLLQGGERVRKANGGTISDCQVHSMPTKAMEFDWNRGALGDGLRCYRREEFFEAHEHWEILWRACRGPEKSFLQALIQMAGGFHHRQRHNLRGATALLTAALRRLEAYPARFGGLDVAPLRGELGQWLEALAKDPALAPPYPQLCIASASDAVAEDVASDGAASNEAGKDG